MAEINEEKIMLAFYNELIRKMALTDYNLKWQVGIYPILSDFENAVSQGTLVLYVEDNQVLGGFVLNHTQGDGYEKINWMCKPEPSEIAVIHLLGADPDQHGKRIGRRLLEFAVNEARKQGVKSLRLDVMPYYKPAIRLYESAEFQKMGSADMYLPPEMQHSGFMK